MFPCRLRVGHMHVDVPDVVRVSLCCAHGQRAGRQLPSPLGQDCFALGTLLLVFGEPFLTRRGNPCGIATESRASS